MATKMTSTEVSGGDDALASDYNELRDDVVLNAGDYAAATGSGNAFILAIDASVASLTEGDVFKFKANHTITGSASLNINSIGAETIKKSDGATNLDSGDITNGQVVEVLWDGSSDIGYKWREVHFPGGELRLSEGEDEVILNISGLVYGDVTRITALSSGTTIQF